VEDRKLRVELRSRVQSAEGETSTVESLAASYHIQRDQLSETDEETRLD
jgi:hypothetical protein